LPGSREATTPQGKYFPHWPAVFGLKRSNLTVERLASVVLWLDGMNNIASFRDLEVWQLAMDLVDLVIADTRRMPRVEFDLRRQLRRAAISIPSNVAEGWRRKKRRGAYQNHVSIAMGSEGELVTEREVCFRNGFLKREASEKTMALAARVSKMLNRLHDSLES